MVHNMTEMLTDQIQLIIRNMFCQIFHRPHLNKMEQKLPERVAPSYYLIPCPSPCK